MAHVSIRKATYAPQVTLSCKHGFTPVKVMRISSLSWNPSRTSCTDMEETSCQGARFHTSHSRMQGDLHAHLAIERNDVHAFANALFGSMVSIPRSQQASW
eukprot:6446833-Amphidinium_carterae.1